LRIHFDSTEAVVVAFLFVFFFFFCAFAPPSRRPVRRLSSHPSLFFRPAGTVRVADVTDASTDANGDVFGSVRLAGGLAVEKSAHVKQKLRVLDDEDGTAAGAGALFVAGGAAVNGYVYLGKDASHSLTLNADLTTTSNAVSIAATADNDNGITLTSSGANGAVSATAKETVSLTGWSDSATGAGGVEIVAGKTNAGFIKLQQDTSGGVTLRDRLVIASDGSVTVTTESGSDLTFNSEGSAPRVVSLNARRAEVSKTIEITNGANTTPTLATVNLESGAGRSRAHQGALCVGRRETRDARRRDSRFAQRRRGARGGCDGDAAAQRRAARYGGFWRLRGQLFGDSRDPGRLGGCHGDEGFRHHRVRRG
jgi:hypothetical protein